MSKQHTIVQPRRADKAVLTASELLKFEAESFSKMQTLQWPSKLALWRNKITSAAQSLKTRSSLDTMVSFEAPNPRAKANNKSSSIHHIDLGAQISLGPKPIVSYFLVIGEKDDKENRCLIRKIHFDLDDSNDSRELKPSRHLQVAGGACPPLLEKGYVESDFSHLRSDIEKPRIPSLPQSFALMLHVAFLEYHSADEKIEKFIKTPGWLSIVTEAEKSVLKPYFDAGHKLLASQVTTKKSLLNHFYGFTTT